MKPNKAMLEDRLQEYEEELKGLNSYAKELKTTSAKLGTNPEQFEDDLMEAEQNIGYYQGEIAGIKSQIGEPADPEPSSPGTGGAVPQTSKQGIGAIVFSSITFVVGALLGSKLKSRKNSKDSD